MQLLWRDVLLADRNDRETSLDWTGHRPLRVVGVVGHVRYWGLAGDGQAQVRAQIYYPFAQVPDRFLRRWSELMSIAVRTNGAPRNFVEPLRRPLRGATGDQVLYQVNTMEQLVKASLAQSRAGGIRLALRGTAHLGRATSPKAFSRRVY